MRSRWRATDPDTWRDFTWVENVAIYLRSGAEEFRCRRTRTPFIQQNRADTRLKGTGEVVDDPDFTAAWTYSLPDEACRSPHRP